jgi:thiol-disulfide isomerase/thioredoxin
MVERILILGAVAVLLAIAAVLLRARTSRKTRALAEQVLWMPLGETPDGRRAVVNFSTPSCSACEQAQAPAISAVERQLGPETVRVIHIDAAREPGVASAFGVLTVPTTVVLAPNGKLVAMNHGFASTRKLVEQLQSA